MQFCTHVLRVKQNFYYSVKMLKLSSVDRARAIGHLEAGWKQQDVAVLFGASQSSLEFLFTNGGNEVHTHTGPSVLASCVRTSRLNRGERTRRNPVTTTSQEVQVRTGIHGSNAHTGSQVLRARFMQSIE